MAQAAHQHPRPLRKRVTTVLVMVAMSLHPAAPVALAKTNSTISFVDLAQRYFEAAPSFGGAAIRIFNTWALLGAADKELAHSGERNL